MYTVQNITTKTVTTKFGPKPAFSIQANDEWYSYGFKKPTFNVGDTIDFKFTDSSYGKNVDLTSLRVISKGSGVPVEAGTIAAPAGPSLVHLPSGSGAATPRYGPPVKPFPIPPLHGDRAIVRQNALTNAREAVASLWLRGVDELPDDVVYANRIIAMARMFEAYSCGDLDLAQAMKESE